MEMRSSFRSNRSLYYGCLLSVLSGTMMISGCYTPNMKMYAGKEVTPDKQATIRCSKPTSGKILIFEVDGKWTSLFHLQFPYEVYVLPGKHNIVIDTYYVGANAIANLWLVAEANETYIVKSITRGNKCQMWIENERTRQPVGGIKGSSDEPK